MMHRNLDRVLVRYTTGDMPAAECQRFEAHLVTCERCQRALGEWRAMADAAYEVAQSRAVSLPPLDFSRIERHPRGEKHMNLSSRRVQYAETAEGLNLGPGKGASPLKGLRSSYSVFVAVISLGFVVIFGTMLMRGGDSGGNVPGLAQSVEVTAESTAEAVVTLSPSTIATPSAELPAGTRMGLPLTDVPNGYGVVVVAMESIDNGSVIDLRSVVLYALPNRFVPDNAPGHIEQVEGRIARTNIHCGQIITDGMLAMNAREVTANMGGVSETLCSSNWGMDPEMRHSTVFIMTDPVDTQDVVVFNQALPAGTIVDRSMLSVEAYPRAIVPFISFEHDAVLGSVLTGDVVADAVLVGDMVAGKVREGMAGITIPVDRYFAASGDFSPGDIVSISGSILVPGSGVDGAAPSFALDQVEGLEVVYAAEMGVTVASDYQSNVARLQSMLESGAQMNLVLEAAVDAGLEGSRVEVSVPVIRIWGGSPMEVGQTVNVMSSMMYVDVSAATGGATPQVESAGVANYLAAGGAVIVAVDDSQITLDILTADRELLEWYVESGAPMWFEAAS